MVRSFTRLVPVLPRCPGTSRLSSALPRLLRPTTLHPCCSHVRAPTTAARRASTRTTRPTAPTAPTWATMMIRSPCVVSDRWVQVRNGSYAGITIAPIAAETTLSGFGTNGTQEAFLGIPYAQQPSTSCASRDLGRSTRAGKTCVRPNATRSCASAWARTTTTSRPT